MKRRVTAMLAALMLLAGTILPGVGVYAEEELEMTVSTNGTVLNKGDGDGILDEMTSDNASILGSLGKTDWTALAASVVKSGKWRDDLVAVAQTQIGYKAGSDGNTIYTEWAEAEADGAWDAQFVSWAAAQAGLSEKQFPRGNSYDELTKAMKKAGALKKISRADYPNTGDVALLDVQGEKLVGVIAHVSNGYAAVIHAWKGEVIRETYRIESENLKEYVDLNVLMQRAGLEVGKGGEAPEIPEGGVAAWTNTNAVYMRKEPTTKSKSVTTVKKSGTAVLVTGAEKQEDGYVWYAVEYKQYKGYIRGDLLKLDMAAVTVKNPAAEEVTPEAPEFDGCAVCHGEAGKTVLPAECCYEHLKALGENAGRFMEALEAADAATWALYVKCHDAHVAAGAEALIPLGGLSVQARVINIDVKKGLAGETITIGFEIYGATAYQWHAVKTAEDGSTEDIEIDGAVDAELTVYAQAGEEISYYCVATLTLDNGKEVSVTSKQTAVSREDSPITAEAILGEEINFSYECEGAAGYQWYVEGEAIPADSTEYTGADSAKLTFLATAENAGKAYYCEATTADGSSTSSSYTYTLREWTAEDAASCEGHDLCRYVEELANMTRVERYTAMTQTWNIEFADGILADYVQAHWAACHKDVYPTLLCTCGANALPGSGHKSSCAWYVKSSSKVERPDECETCTEEMECFSYYCDDLKLPEIGCFYDHLVEMGNALKRYDFLAELLAKEAAAKEVKDWDLVDYYYYTYMSYINSHEAHDGNLLCTCGVNTAPVAPGATHSESCPWYMTEEDLAELEQEIAIADRIESEPEFAEWMETASEEMIARALTVKSLDHVAIEANDDGTYNVYVVRYEEPVGTVSADGFLTYAESDRIIAWIDFDTNMIYPIYDLPDHAPAVPAAQ